MQKIETTCDICGDIGDRFPSWFEITQRQKPVGQYAIKMVPDKADWHGYARYEKYIDLCPKHRDKIIEAIDQIIVIERK